MVCCFMLFSAICNNSLFPDWTKPEDNFLSCWKIYGVLLLHSSGVADYSIYPIFNGADVIHSGTSKGITNSDIDYS